MASIISGMAPPSLARTTAAVSAENADPEIGPEMGPEMGRASGRETSASSRTLNHRPDASSAPRHDRALRYQ